MPDVVPPAFAFHDDAASFEQRMSDLDALLRHPGLYGVPLVVLARDADIDSFASALARGAAAYLVKPAEGSEVVAVAQRLSAWLAASDRADDRHRLRRPLLLAVDVASEGRPAAEGWILDVGGGGCRIEVAAPLQEDEQLRLTLHGVGGSTAVSLNGRVRWLRGGPEAAVTAGLRFSGTSAVLAERLFGAAGTSA